MHKKRCKKYTISDMQRMGQHKSREKYGKETPTSLVRELNCTKSSMHTSTYPSTTNTDLESHDPPVRKKISHCKQQL